MSRADIEGLLRSLAAADVRFVVIDGVAVTAHGFIRTTEDVDIVPAPDTDNLLRLGNALAAMDARSLLEPEHEFSPEHHDTLARHRNLSLTTRFADIDVVQRLPGVPVYAELEAQALPAEPFGIPILVASIAHLRQMKQARGSAQDLADLEALDVLARDDPS